MPRRTHSETVESLVNIALATARFRSRESAVYFRIPCGAEGHQTVLLDSEIGRAWLATQYLEICHEPPSRAALAEAVTVITRLSLVGDPGSDCPLRILGQGNLRRPDVIPIDQVQAATRRSGLLARPWLSATAHFTEHFGGHVHSRRLPLNFQRHHPVSIGGCKPTWTLTTWRE
jgi:hypothetical protein